MRINLDRCLEGAKTIVWEAVDLLETYYGETGDPNLCIQEYSADPVTAADLAVNQYIVEQLQRVFPDPAFGYLTEENDKSRTTPLPHPWVWVLDPIDGTRDFIEKTGEFTLHLALLHGQVPVLALLAVPAEGKLYTAIQGQGTFVEYRSPWTVNVDSSPSRLTSPVRVSSRYELADLKLVIGRNGRYPRFAMFLDAFPVKQRVWGGSLGYKIVQILEQRGDVYLSLSGRSAPKDWDLAAPDLILQEAGGKLSREDGLALRYNQGNPSQWGCLIGSNRTCHSQLCAAANRILNEWMSF
ncbi:MAG: 3'(2'),5'-bisphosphate nucleotidase CysQ family protein [Prochlorotrichaceae cyanobacterium]